MPSLTKTRNQPKPSWAHAHLYPGSIRRNKRGQIVGPTDGGPGLRFDTLVVAASDTDLNGQSVDLQVNGVSDQAQIQDRMADVFPSGGGTVKLLDGTYEFDGYIAAEHTTFVGEGLGTLINFDSGGLPAIVPEIDGTVRGIQFAAVGSSVGTPAIGYGDGFTSPPGGTVDGCWFFDCAVDLYGSDQSRLLNCYFEGKMGGHCADLSNGGLVMGNVFRDVTGVDMFSPSTDVVYGYRTTTACFNQVSGTLAEVFSYCGVVFGNEIGLLSATTFDLSLIDIIYMGYTGQCDNNTIVGDTVGYPYDYSTYPGYAAINLEDLYCSCKGNFINLNGTDSNPLWGIIAGYEGIDVSNNKIALFTSAYAELIRGWYALGCNIDGNWLSPEDDSHVSIRLDDGSEHNTCEGNKNNLGILSATFFQDDGGPGTDNYFDPDSNKEY